jgi:hypothetical protein
VLAVEAFSFVLSRVWRRKQTEMLFLNTLVRMLRISVVLVFLLAADACVMIDDSSSSSARARNHQQTLSPSSSLLSPSSSPPPPDEAISSPKRLSDQEDERIRKRLKSEQVSPAHADHTPTRFSDQNETHLSADSPGNDPTTIGATAPSPTLPTEDRAKQLRQVADERRKAIASLSMLTSAQRSNEALAAFVATQVAECKVRLRTARAVLHGALRVRTRNDLRSRALG